MPSSGLTGRPPSSTDAFNNPIRRLLGSYDGAVSGVDQFQILVFEKELDKILNEIRRDVISGCDTRLSMDESAGHLGM